MVSQKADQRDVVCRCEFDGEAGGRTDGYYYSYASHRGLLQQFKTGAAAQQKNRGRERQCVAGCIVADDLVEGVVAADIFAQDRELCVAVEQGCGVQSTGGIKNILVFKEAGWQCIDRPGIDRGFFGWIWRRALLVNGFDGTFAADTAARRRVEVTLKFGRIEGDVVVECNGYSIGCLLNRLPYSSSMRNNTLGKKESDCELFIMAGSSHGNRYGRATAVGCGAGLHADFEGLFCSDLFHRGFGYGPGR